MVDHPVFPFPNPKAYLETMSRKSIPFIGDLIAGVHLKLLEPEELRIITEIREQRVGNPLKIEYWSVTPYWLGSAAGEDGCAIKYLAVPHETSDVAPENPELLPGDYLTQALRSGLQSGEAIFDFKVQLQADPNAMPVEDVSVRWDEGVSKPETVATLHIPPQSIDPVGDLAAKCESLSFNPWHALAEHRPMGGMNRLRKLVYQASLQKRTES
jgi:hypothetical protein